MPTFTAPSGMTETWDLQTTGTYKMAIESAHAAQQSSGATGTKTATLSTAQVNIGLLIAITPAAPSVRSISSGFTANPTSQLVLSKPSGTIQNDVLVAFVTNNGGQYCTVPTPSGWTVVPNTDQIAGSTDAHTHAFYKVAGAAEPASYTFTQSGDGCEWDLMGGIYSIAGATTGSPINASGAQANASGTSCTSPSITTNTANTLLLFSCSSSGPAPMPTFTPPSGMTEAWDVQTNGTYKMAIESAHAAQQNSGATGGKIATLSTAQVNVGLLIAIAP
jgi:hypothetical protein